MRLSKREYFAAMNMASIVMRCNAAYAVTTQQDIAREAIDCADALIAELNKPKPNRKDNAHA